MDGIFIYIYTVLAVIYLFPCAWGSNNKEPIQTGIAVRHAQPPIVFAHKHQDLLLNCSVEYDSDLGRLEISWSKDGMPLDLGPKGKIQKFLNGSLYIKRFRHRPKKDESNEGHYRCYASLIDKDELVGRIVARDVHVKVAGIERKFDVEPQPQNVSVGGAARFQCKIGAVPMAMYIWRQNKTSLPQNDNRYLELNSGILQITDVREKDAGLYQCYATQVLLHDLPGSDIDGKYSTEALLQVVPGEKLVTKIVASSKNVTSKVGSPALLECLVQGYKGNVQWKHNAETLNINNGKGRIEMIGNNLRILQTLVADEGRYECIAGQEKATMVLNIIQRPVITYITESIQIVKSQWMYLECKADGHPKPKITWLKDGKDIDYTKNVEQSDLKDGSQLALTISQEYNSGYYQCVASNEAGSEMALLRVKVIKKDAAPDMATNLTAVVVTNTSIYLRWRPPVDPPAFWYTVHYQKDSDKYKDEKVVDKTQIELIDLRPASRYEIYVAAFNSRGAGSESEHVFVTTLEGVPSRAPVVTLEPRSTSILVKWEPIPLSSRNGKITHYKIYVREKGKQQDMTQIIEDVPGTASSHLISGLEAETVYDVRVLAGTAVGIKFPVSETLFPWVSVQTRNVVAPTLHMSVTPLDGSSINVSWTCNTIYTVVDYTITLYMIPSGQLVKSHTVPANVSHVVFNQLDDSSFYKITVTVTTDNMLQSEVVEEFSFMNVPTLPSPQNLRVSLVSTDHFNVEWEQPDSDIEIISFTLRYRQNEDGIYYSVDSDSDSYLLENLQPFTRYEVWVRAKGKKILSPYSTSVVVQTAPGSPSEPQKVEVSAVTKDTVNVVWKAPIQPNGPIQSYTILYTTVSNRSDEEWTSYVHDGTQESAQIKLQDVDSKVFYFKLHANSESGAGKMSSLVQFNSEEFSSVGSSSAQRPRINMLGIIIGSVIGVVFIIVCVLCLCCWRRKCFGERSPMPPATQPSRIHGNGHIPGNGNGHAIQMAESPPTVNVYEMDAYTPMLHSLPENEHSDTKGGGDSNVILTPNGAKLNGFVSFKHNGMVNGQIQNGHMTSFLPNQYKDQNIDAEETRGLIAAMLAGSCEQCMTANVGEESFTTSRYEDLGSLDNIDTGSSEDGIHKSCDKDRGNSGVDSGEGSLTASGDGSMTVSDRSSTEYASSVPRSDVTDTGDTVVYCGSVSLSRRPGVESVPSLRNGVNSVNDGECLPIQLPQSLAVSAEDTSHDGGTNTSHNGGTHTSHDGGTNPRLNSTDVDESRDISGSYIPQVDVNDSHLTTATSNFLSQETIDNVRTDNGKSPVTASHSPPSRSVIPQVLCNGSTWDVESHRRRHPAASSNALSSPGYLPHHTTTHLNGVGVNTAVNGVNTAVNGVNTAVNGVGVNGVGMNTAVSTLISQGDTSPDWYSPNSTERRVPSGTGETTLAGIPHDRHIKLSNITVAGSNGQV